MSEAINNQKTYDRLINHLNKHYNFGITKMCSVAGGYLSDNFIAYNGSEEYFVKTYRSKYDRQDIENIHKVKQFFSENGVPIIMPLKTKNGKTLTDFEEQHYAVFPFIRAKQIKPEKASLKAVESMARMQARIHLLSKNELPKIHETKVRVWHKSKALKKGEKILKILKEIKEPDDFDKMALQLTPWKIEEIKKSRVTPSSIGLKNDHLIHGDYHGLNLFFDESDEVKYVYDLEKTVLAPRSYELVRAIDYICLNDFNLEKAGEYLSAYREVYPISDSEFRKGFLFYATKGIYTFWIEEAHYVDQNYRTDVFYENDTSHTKYYHLNFDEMVKKILELSRKA